MPKTVIKISKLLILGFLPLFLISGRSMVLESPSVSIQNYSNTGVNFIKVLGASSEVAITADTFKNVDGVSCLKLQLAIAEEEQPYAVALFITGYSDAMGIADKNYVVKPISGFLNGVNEIFGVVTMDALGEQPFFSKTGNIKLVAMSNNMLKANMNMQFANERGESITVYGEFETIKN